MVENVSTVDCSNIVGKFEQVSNQSLTEFATKFGNALHDIGFVYLINHGIDMKKISNLYEVSKSFFELPTDVKQKYRKQDPRKNFNGYSGPGDFQTYYKEDNPKVQVELKELWDVWGEDGYKPDKFPSEVPDFQYAFEQFREDMINLALKLLRAFALYLNLDDKDFFLKHHRGIVDQKVRTHSQLRSMYYPVMPVMYENGEARSAAVEINRIRCAAHCDWGTITLNFQDMVGGLEAKTQKGNWIPITPVKDAILINTGQLLEIWSGGRIPAAPHRVVIMEKERLLQAPRQSIIYFVDPDGDTEVQPIAPIIEGKDYLVKQPPINAWNYSQTHINVAMSY